MRKKGPRAASADEVRIRREGDGAVVEFADETIATAHLRIGPAASRMTDDEILAMFNETMRDRERRRAEHVVIEIPSGRSQLEYDERSDQWTPRGGLLRCLVSDRGPEGELTIQIDDREFSLGEFGRRLATHAGWGMRVAFVPDDEVLEEPRIEVRDPTRK